VHSVIANEFFKSVSAMKLTIKRGKSDIRPFFLLSITFFEG